MSHTVVRSAGKKVEDMFARSMAWYYLKQFGLNRPKVVIVRARNTSTKVDVKKMVEERSTAKRVKVIPHSSRRLNVAQKPKIFKM